jgi:putative ABC transport system substrate-binding protein
MRRRKFITLLGSAAAVWPFVARAEQRDRTRLVGVLMFFAESDPTAQSMVAAFRNGQREIQVQLLPFRMSPASLARHRGEHFC